MEKTISYYDWNQSFHKKPLDTISRFASQFSSLYKKETLYKTASLCKEDFTFIELNLDLKKIKCRCLTCTIEIDSEKKTIAHKCGEFRTASRFYKHFCSHLLKMFMLLLEEDASGAEQLLHEIQFTYYEFITK